MRKPDKTDVELKLLEAFARAQHMIRATGDGEDGSKDVAGHDSWQLAANAISVAIGFVEKAHAATGWEFLPEPKPVIQAGDSLGVNKNGEVVQLINASSSRIVGVALNAAAPGETVAVALGEPGAGGWQATSNMKAGEPTP